MILSREFIPANILFKSDDVFLLDALEEVYERMGSNAAVTEGMQAVYQPTGGIKLFLPCNEVPFQRPVRVDHWMRWKVWNEFSSAFMNLPHIIAVKDACDLYLTGATASKDNLTKFYASSFKDCLDRMSEKLQGEINHRDLLRFYLGLSKIPDEKIFNLL